MDKLLIEIFLPAAGKSIDVQVPLKLKIWEIISMLSEVVDEISNGSFASTGQTTLCDRKTGAILDVNITVEELGLKNGSKLMFI